MTLLIHMYNRSVAIAPRTEALETPIEVVKEQVHRLLGVVRPYTN